MLLLPLDFSVSNCYVGETFLHYKMLTSIWGLYSLDASRTFLLVWPKCLQISSSVSWEAKWPWVEYHCSEQRGSDGSTSYWVTLPVNLSGLSFPPCVFILGKMSVNTNWKLYKLVNQFLSGELTSTEFQVNNVSKISYYYKQKISFTSGNEKMTPTIIRLIFSV